MHGFLGYICLSMATNLNEAMIRLHTMERGSKDRITRLQMLEGV